MLGPGCSQLLFTLAVRDAGPSRTSVTVGTAPLFSVAIALVLLDEPAKAGVIAGAILIVFGGILLVREPGRPEHVKWIGLGFALAATMIFAVRDNLVRHLSLDTEVEPALAAAATLFAGGLTVAVWLLADAAARPGRRLPRLRPGRRLLRPLLPLPLRGVLPRPGLGRLAARRDGVALGRRALGLCSCAGTSSSGRASSAAPRSSSPAAC